MMRAFILGGLALLAACAPARDKPGAPAASAAEVAAPTPDDVAVHIRAADAGKRVHVTVGQRFAIELIGVPTAGYVWAPAQLPGFVSRAGEATGNTTAAQSQPGFAGGNHWEVLMFVATAPGSGELSLDQRRPWESNEPPAQTFSVTIVASE